MKPPGKVLSTDSYADVKRKLNDVTDYLRSTRLAPGPGVRLRQYSNGTIIEAAGRSSSGGDGAGYDGWFCAEAIKDGDSTLIRVYDAGDPDNSIAGLAYVNGKLAAFPCDELAPAEGWLCLMADGEEAGYEILSDAPDLFDPDSETAYHLLAEVKRKDGEWSVRLLVRYVVPQLWIGGECEDDE